MIGKVYTSVFPYYDTALRTNSFKNRPVLIISDARNNDYTILPISTVSKRENLDKDYDIEIDPVKFPELGLKKLCYIRTHKQTTVHASSLNKELGDLKASYIDTFLLVITRLDEFNKKIMEKCLNT